MFHRRVVLGKKLCSWNFHLVIGTDREQGKLLIVVIAKCFERKQTSWLWDEYYEATLNLEFRSPCNEYECVLKTNEQTHL